ncbi:SMP protein, partial [Tricholaema leucomelas]|nr:SMP protein [Tricholaema leucomelas]
GSRVELSCQAQGHPLPLLSWFRGGVLLREEPDRTGLELVLARVEPEQAGTYWCLAENRHGRSNRSLLLEVA